MLESEQNRSDFHADPSEDNDQVQNFLDIHEGKNGYHSVYTTPDGGTGYSFTPYTEPKNSDRSPKKKPGNSRVRRAFLLAGIIAFGMVVCFCSGYAGSMMARFSDIESTATESEGKLYRPNVVDKGTSSDRGGPGSSVNGYTTVAQVVSQVGNSVVQISTSVYSSNVFSGESFASSGNGSGVVISEDGYILTNAHVVDGASAVSVRTNDGVTFDAVLVGYDEASDLAVVKVDPDEYSLCPVQFGVSSDLVTGEQILVIGNPFGLGESLSVGYISTVERSVALDSDGTIMTLIQTDATVTPANSGGGMFNLDGKLVGVVNARISSNDLAGLGFAIPVDAITEIVNDLCEYGYVRGVVSHGLSCVDVTSKNLMMYRYQYGIMETGVYVVSSQYCTDLKNKDLILSVNGISVSTIAELDQIVSSHSVGDTLELRVRRNGTDLTVYMDLQEYVPAAVSYMLP